MFRGGHSASAPWSQLLAKDEYAKAIDCLIGLTWQDYDGQVVEFLDSESRNEYSNKDAWQRLQNQVLTQLEANA